MAEREYGDDHVNPNSFTVFLWNTCMVEMRIRCAQGIIDNRAPFAESTVLALAHAYERETEWHKRHPKLDLA